MIFSKYNASTVFIVIALLFNLSACNSASEKADPNILTTAWLTCESATGTSNGGHFTGKAVLVWNLHPEMVYQRNNKDFHTEQIGNLWLNNAPYFILGSGLGNNNYQEYNKDFFTLSFDELGALLCVSVNYTDIETCNYHSGYYVIRAIAEADVKLVSWPGKNLIGETHVVTNPPTECAPSIPLSSIEEDHSVFVESIDIWKWFLQYKQ